MRYTKKYIREIMTKHKQDFDELEHYDKTREKLWGRSKINLTLNNRILNKLKKMRASTGKPISRIIEELIPKD